MQSAVSEPIKSTSKPARQFANDGSYESVKPMLRKLAFNCFARVQALGLPMEFDDVMQEMNLGYVKALSAWTPDRSKFITFCTLICQREFNGRVEKMARERKELGMVSIDDMMGCNSDEETDGYTRFRGRDEECCGSPEEIRERRQIVMGKIANLSRPAKLLIGALLKSEFGAARTDVNLHDLAANFGITGKTFKDVREEIATVFGVRIPANRGTRRPKSIDDVEGLNDLAQLTPEMA